MSREFFTPLAIPLLRLSDEDSADSSAKLREEVAVLFDELRAPLLRFLSTFGLEMQDGEEVLQDAFLSLFGYLSRGKSIDNVRSWLYRVAHNMAIRRRQKNRRDGEVQLDAAGPGQTADPAPSPETCIASRQSLSRVMAVVDALAEQDRQCLFLRAEGLRYREIAEILDMSLGAVSGSIARSLARIARSVESRTGAMAAPQFPTGNGTAGGPKSSVVREFLMSRTGARAARNPDEKPLRSAGQKSSVVREFLNR